MTAKQERATLSVGQRFEVPYPFIRETFSEWDEEGEQEVPTWKPGTRYELVYPDDSRAVADGLGTCVLTVVSLHKPGKYPSRVFFTRTWVSPEGKAFGKTCCRVVVESAFRSLIQGFRHPFALAGCECDGCKWPFDDHRRALAIGGSAP